MHGPVGQRQRQLQRRENQSAGQHGAGRKQRGRQGVFLQQPARFNQTVHGALRGIAERHPGQHAHDEKRTQPRRRRAAFGLPGAQGKHHVKHQVISRNAQRGLRPGPQQPARRTGKARLQLAQRQLPQQAAQAQQGAGIR